MESINEVSVCKATRCSYINASNAQCHLNCCNDSNLCTMHKFQSSKNKCEFIMANGNKCDKICCNDSKFCVTHIRKVPPEGFKILKRPVQEKIKKPVVRKVKPSFFNNDARTKVAEFTKTVVESGKMDTEMNLLTTLMTILAEKIHEKETSKPEDKPRCSHINKKSGKQCHNMKCKLSDLCNMHHAQINKPKKIPDNRCTYIAKSGSQCFLSCYENGELCSLHKKQKEKRDTKTVHILPAPNYEHINDEDCSRVLPLIQENV